MTAREIRELVEEGARLLDTAKPGWEKRINLDLLSMPDCKMCVLGQLYGEYDYGKGVLGIGWGFEYGFNADPEDYDDLFQAWTDLIRERLESP